MPTLPTTPFERSLAASGLVPHERLAAVQATASSLTLPQALVDQGLLNSWQVDQLWQGRTKFSLGPYQIIDAVGRGGMGHVFKGRHAMLGRVEAIKVLPRERTRGEAVESFLREIRSQAQLDHPNIVRVSYADRDGETYYLVTEYVPGIDLRRLVRRAGALPIDVAAYLVLEVASALEHAHRRGMVHRDVKPGNVLVTPQGDVKVTDLGLAWRLEDQPQAEAGHRRRVVGTCDYLSPETVQRPACIMPVSDIYSLGCTLYYALTGKVPYPGGNAREKLRRVVNDEPLDPTTLRPDLPRKLVKLLGELMHKNPDRRTPTAAIAGERLASYVNPDSRDRAAELVTRFARRPAEGEVADSGSEDTIEEPIGADPLAPSQPPPSDPSQTTSPLASAEEETAPGYDSTAPVAPATCHDSPRTAVDVWVRMVTIAASVATAALVLSALWRS